MENFSFFALLSLKETLVPAVLFKLCFVFHYFGLRELNRSLIFFLGVLFFVSCYVARNLMYLSYFDGVLLNNAKTFQETRLFLCVAILLLGFFHFLDWIRIKANKPVIISFSYFKNNGLKFFRIIDIHLLLTSIVVILLAFFFNFFHLGSHLEYMIFIDKMLYIDQGIFFSLLDQALLVTFFISHIVIFIIWFLILFGKIEQLKQQYPAGLKLLLSASCFCSAGGLFYLTLF